MAKTLVLAEKPSVGKELARVLGAGKGGEGYLEGPQYIVTWALGHLVTLADPEEYDPKYKTWEMEDLPMLPEKRKLTVIRETSRQYRVVQGLMKRPDVGELVIATDAGREGELVARWIMEKAGWRGKTRRLWISSQTDRAIRDGFQHLRPAAEYDDLYRSAEARSQADWFVGLNVTRALTCRYGASLSAGRVQTPTLSLLVEREREIREFVPKEYFTVSAKTDLGFQAYWRDGKGQSHLSDRERAEALRAKLQGKKGRIIQLKKQVKQVPPPAAYDLTELQRDANRKYAYSAKETLNLMQSLYERHKLLTYPRTDSRYISDDVVPTLPERLQAMRFGDYAPLVNRLLRSRPLQTRYLVNNAKVTDHHAILPTEEPADFRYLSGPEQNIYDLVARRFAAVLLPPFSYEEMELTIQCEGETLRAKGRRVLEEGWHEAYGSALPEEDEETEERSQKLPELRQGDDVLLREARVAVGKTSPPARYTEAALLTAMEHPNASGEDKRTLEETGGLGTPATRADIIEKLLSSFYVERVGKTLVPTSKGTQLVSLVPEELRSPLLTARWETRLGAIAAGKEKPESFLKEMKQYASGLVTEVKAAQGTYRHDNATRERCPDCGAFLLAVTGKKGNRMLVCPDRSCGYRKSLSVVTNARCPNCHKKLELRGEGDKRMFVCVCGYREKLSDFEKRREDKGAGKRDVQKYMASQDRGGGNTALAEALKKWSEQGAD